MTYGFMAFIFLIDLTDNTFEPFHKGFQKGGFGNFVTKCCIEWRYNFNHCCANSKFVRYYKGIGFFRPVGSREGGQVGSSHPIIFENDGVTSQLLIRCIVLYCFENKWPLPNQQLLLTALLFQRYPVV